MTIIPGADDRTFAAGGNYFHSGANEICQLIIIEKGADFLKSHTRHKFLISDSAANGMNTDSNDK